MSYKRNNSTKSGKHHEQNKKFNRVEIIKRTKQIIELKNTMYEMKNTIESINSRPDEPAESVCEVKESSFEID